MATRVAYLGPAGTFSEDALLSAAGTADIDPLPRPSVYAAIRAVAEGEAERALVPFENSIEGSVRATLDTLAFEAPSVAIVGEHDQPITNSLIARSELELEEIELVLSHPQASAQCARFIRAELRRARMRAASSTAEAVREDAADNVTRFIWLAPAGTTATGNGAWKTSISFSELGADHPGALVEALTEFSSRSVNLTRIESRPLRRGLGRYMFFCDLEGAGAEPPVREAIEAVRAKAENVRVLGSYPIHTEGIPAS